jgi:hypothetical protein
MPASLLLLKAYGLTECRTHTFYAPFLGLANAFFQTIGYPGLCHFHGGIFVHFLRILFRKRARLNLRISNLTLG